MRSPTPTDKKPATLWCLHIDCLCVRWDIEWLCLASVHGARLANGGLASSTIQYDYHSMHAGELHTMYICTCSLRGDELLYICNAHVAEHIVQH